VITSTKYANCEVLIGKTKIFIDLIKLGEMEFDVILGMDRLSAYSVHVYYNGKRVMFRIKGIPEFIFEGVKANHDIPIISAVRATKLMRQRCQEFLASVSDANGTNIKIEIIPVVNDYPDVFPEDLSRLPQDQDVKFLIEVLPGNATITKAPYHMAAAEME